MPGDPSAPPGSRFVTSVTQRYTVSIHRYLEALFQPHRTLNQYLTNVVGYLWSLNITQYRQNILKEVSQKLVQ